MPKKSIRCDLNAFKVYDRDTFDHIYADLKNVQKNLHYWGHANQVTFDAGKESFHILSRLYLDRGPDGENFRLLGICFDPKFLMGDAAHECVAACHWKMQGILRARRFYSTAELIGLYKAHILSYIEYRTPAIAHAAATVLAPIDSIQARFLREIGLTEEDALLQFKLAPLHTRRDIAMLGVIHRTAIGQGPPQFRRLFPLSRYPPLGSHGRHIVDFRAHHRQEYFQRSTFGYVKIYNELNADFVGLEDVKTFQRKLQTLICSLADARVVCWQNALRDSHDDLIE